MTADKCRADYFLGNTDAEHERLIRQAIRLAPVTERFSEKPELDLGNAS
jgi:hypothetical protein